jgi:hypothetical protein
MHAQLACEEEDVCECSACHRSPYPRSKTNILLNTSRCVERDPPIQHAIDAGAVSACASLLRSGNRSAELQVEVRASAFADVNKNMLVALLESVEVGGCVLLSR